MSDKSTPFIEINNLSFARGERLIFDNISMVFPRGKITAIMGPSGTGKTTLLRLIGGKLIPGKGTILFDGSPINTKRNKQLYGIRRRIGMLFQNGALFTNLSVFENVAFPLREHTQLNECMITDIVMMKLQSVGLRGAAQLMPSQLSGGMSRRVALARAIVMDPDLMMYDEPFTGQDPISMGVIVALIKELNEALNLTSIIVSHDIHETAAIADFIYIISGGKVVAHGSPDELFKNQNPAVVQFMKGLPDGVVPFHYPARPYEEDLFE